MRLLMAMNVPYTRSHGGANRSNRGLIEALVRRGHECWVLSPALAQPSAITLAEWSAELTVLGLELATAPDGSIHFDWGGVHVVAVPEQGRVRATLARLIETMAFDRVLVSSEDPSQSLLAAALDAAPGRVVWLALTPPLFPFGPESLYPSDSRTNLVCAAAVACLSDIVADYISAHAGVRAFVYHPPSFGRGPFPLADSFDEGAVLLMNACAVKGLPIFLALARHFPDHRFAALPGYGTTTADRAALAGAPNIALWRNERELDTVLSRTKVVVVPSLWMESFGMVVVDAMLRGIPVLAADYGALPETALGAARLLPVQPITRYRREPGDNLLPVPIVPHQDAGPWVAALEPLLTDRTHWEAASRAARAAALPYVEGLTAEPFERMLTGLPTNTPAPPARPAAALNQSQRARLLRELRAAAPASTRSAIPKQPRGAPLPLSFAQSRLWFLWRLDPASGAYNCPSALRLHGWLDEAALANALTSLADRHETLRTIIGETPDGPVQHILDAGTPPNFARQDLSALAETQREAAARTLIAREASAPFDLMHDRPFRALLIRLALEQHILLLTVHHIATDGWSAGLLVSDLSALYAAAGTPLPRQYDYADYALWQREQLSGPVLDRLLGYWTSALAGAPPVIALPFDRSRPLRPVRPGANRAITVPPSLTERLKVIGQDQNASLFMVMLAGFGVLLHRLGRSHDIVVGTPVANRTREAFEGIVGLFVNTLPLRIRFACNPRFADFLRQVRDVVLAGLAHQALPFERLVEALAPERTRTHTPVFQVLFSVSNTGTGDLSLPGLTVESITTYSGTAKLDLNVELTETARGLEGTIEYDAELFDAETIDRIAEAYTTLLTAIAAAPERRIGALPLTSGPIAEIPAPLPADPDLIALVRAGAARRPEAPALWARGETIDHRTLDDWSSQIAQRLVAHLTKTCEARVAICLDRSAAQIAAVLAVLKAGAACVPLDPAYPAERLTWMRNDAGVSAILTGGHHAALFAENGVPVIVLDDAAQSLSDSYRPDIGRDWRGPEPGAQSPAYILYTSGSTGRPKGVSLPRAALANLVQWHLDRLPGPARMLQFASLGFDVSFLEILGTLAGGGTIVLLDDTGRRDLDQLPRFLAAHVVEQAILPVVAIHRLAEAMIRPDAPTLALRHLISTGEALNVTPALTAWIARRSELTLHNYYGPTETHVVTAATLSDLPFLGGPFPPIGRPIRATGVRLLDAYLNPVPPGLPGELFLTGANLARGYHSRPDATAEAFLPDPSGRPGDRMYRTGDLARARLDGQLAWSGRIDQQIKIRGHRVEPGEIETALRDIPGIADCLVIARDAASEESQLVAYIVPVDVKAGPDPRMLAEHLRRTLPPHLVPAAFVRLARLPLNTNGKIDRAALPAPAAADTEAGDRVAGGGPRTELETQLANIWGQVLQRPEIGIDDNFFALGGHSLLMIQVTARISRELNVELPVQQFFDHPTIAMQAEVVALLLASRDEDADLEALLDEIETLPYEEADRLIGRPTPDMRARAIEAWAEAAIGAADPTVRVPLIDAIGFPSSGRSGLLDQAIRSYAANLLNHGRSVDIVVASDPADAAQERSYRAMLAGVARDTGLPVRYAGPAEKRAYLDRLARETGVDGALLTWAISDDWRSGNAYGANRNALLLDGAGSLILSFDDDTVARPLLPRDPRPGVALQTERRVSEIRLLSGGAEEADFTFEAPVDLVGAHQGILGRPVGAILRETGGPQGADGARAEPANLGDSETARVVATYHGWSGDSGWASSAEVRFLTGTAWDWVTRSEEAYWEALEAPMLVRYTSRPILSRAPEFFVVGGGFDARADLPPFLPRFRREDVLYGATLARGLPGGFVVHLPVAIGHGRPRGVGTTGQELIDVAEIVETVLEQIPENGGWAAIGAGLTETGWLPPDEFRTRIGGWLIRRTERELGALDQRIRQCPPDRAYWARDARAAADILRGRLQSSEDLLPRRAFRAASAGDAQRTLQGFLTDLGRLFTTWPQVMAAAAALRIQGVRLSQPVSPNG
jgi:amino acid adenylation domain-containing protein